MRRRIVNKTKVFLLLAVFLVNGCAVLASKQAAVGCQAADTLTTLHATSLGGQELNPFVRWLLENTGPIGFVSAKLAVTLLFVHVHPEMSADLVRLVNGVTCTVALHNARVARRLEKKAQASE